MKLKKAATHLGDLARAVRLDNYRPRKNTLEEWESYLEAMGADIVVIENLYEAWNLYEAGKSPPKSEHERNLDLKDERWSIQRPALPSFWTRTPEVICVGCNEKKGTLLKDDCFSFEVNLYVHFVCSRKFCNAVEQLARYFQREFNYDFLPYTVGEHMHEGDSRIQPYLFFSSQEYNDIVARPIGACGFMLPRDYEHCVMNWVWMHPYARRKGHLTKVWPYFRRRYEDFRIMTPLSESMDAFLKKMEYRYLCS